MPLTGILNQKSWAKSRDSGQPCETRLHRIGDQFDAGDRGVLNVVVGPCEFAVLLRRTYHHGADRSYGREQGTEQALFESCAKLTCTIPKFSTE